MERIMPIDLENARPRKGFRGYRPEDVDPLLEGAAQSLEQAITDNGVLREKNELQRAEIERLREQESLIKDALVAAQRAADDLRASAQRHADLILEEARQAALAERVSAQQKVSELRWELERMRTDRQRFVDEFQALLQRYGREINQAPDLQIVDGPLPLATVS